MVWQTLKRWYHMLGSPRYFYTFSSRVLPWLTPIALLTLAAGLIWGLAFAPADYQQGNSYRIIFIHVPASSGALMGYMALGVSGLVAVVWRMKMAEVMLKAIAPFGAALAAISLVTGALWGKPTWGTYWQWDARMTSMLILLFLYLGVIALRGAFSSRDSGSRAASVLAMVGVINIPIIKYSVDWWYTLHQPATFTITGRSAMTMDMWAPLLIMVLGFYSFFIALTLMRTRSEILRREANKRWVRELAEETN